MPTENGGKHVSVAAPAGAEPDEIAKAFQAFRQKKLAEKRAREEAERMKSEGATAPLGGTMTSEAHSSRFHPSSAAPTL